MGCGLDDPQIYLGESTTLSISIEGAAVDRIDLELPKIDGLTFEGPFGPATSSYTSSVNGRVSQSVTTLFRYRVTGTTPGTYEIPAFVVTVQGRKFQVSPHRLEVARPPEDARIVLRASVDKTECYPWEPVTLAYTLYFAKPIRDHAFSLPLLADASALHLRLVPPERGRARDEAVLRGYRDRLPVERGVANLEGQDYQTWTLRFRLHPEAPGELVLPAAGVAAEIVIGEKVVSERDFFGIVRRVPVAETTTVRAVSDSLRIRVMDFPSGGRPDGFYGLVGAFSIAVEADRKRANVGDPILLRIRVTGEGILESVQRPDLASLPAFTGFKIEEDLTPGQLEGDSIVFEQRIRARSEEVTEIPAVPLPYFDFAQGRYVVARSEPIAVEILPTDVVTAKDIEGTGGETHSFVEARALEEKPGGLHANYLFLDALRDQQVKTSRLWLLLAAPLAFAALALTVRVTRARRADEAAVRARGAKRRARRELAHAEGLASQGGPAFYEALARAIHGFFHDRFALGAGEITALDLRALREGERIGPEVEEEAGALVAACDAGRFGAGASGESDRGALVHRARKLIGEVGRR